MKKYAKPMILNINRATSAIQGLGKADTSSVDASNKPHTIPAYEADE